MLNKMLNQSLQPYGFVAKDAPQCLINDQGEKVPSLCRNYVEIRAKFWCRLGSSPKWQARRSERVALNRKDQTMFMKHSTHFEPAALITLKALALNPASQPVSTGLVSGSLVETTTGWQPVETLTPGVRVATYDGGFRALAALDRSRLLRGAASRIVDVPAGAIDNCSPFSVLSDQHVFLASSVAEDVLDAAGALVPAASLVGYRGIASRPACGSVEVLSLRFEDEEIVYVNSGALIHCAAAGRDHVDASIHSEFFDVLTEDRARAMLSLIAEGAGCGDQMAAA